MSQYFDDKDLFVGPKVEQYGSHVVMTGVQRETKVKLLNVDTLFRDDYNSSTLIDYNITFPETITNVKSIYVADMEIPIGYYIISENLQNNTFTLTEYPPLKEPKDIVITVPDGEYDRKNGIDYGSDLIEQLNAQFVEAGIGDIHYSIEGNKSVFKNIGPSRFEFNFAVDSDGNFNKNLFRSRLGYILGFRTPTLILDPINAQSSPAFVNLLGPKYLFLVIEELNGQGNENSFVSYLPYSQINKNILARLSMDGVKYSFNTMHIKDVTSDMRKYNGPKDIKRINVKIINEFGQIMDLNGHDISFCLRIEYV
tara:strand:- start:2308 stop:3240 length:933 start_codon:yes stop_codon:yes gene_type:complete